MLTSSPESPATAEAVHHRSVTGIVHFDLRGTAQDTSSNIALSSVCHRFVVESPI